MSLAKKSPNKISVKIKEYLLPIVLISGLSLLVFYYVFKYGFPSFYAFHFNGFKELFGIALTILGSGIFLAVLKWFQFMGFFKEEILEVLYSDDFLKNKNILKTFGKKLPDAISKVNFLMRLAIRYIVSLKMFSFTTAG